MYLSMVPEALVASMLPPEEFGHYLAVGTKKRSRGNALFFDLKDGFQSDAFDLASVVERCVPHPDGEPKHSVYAAIYRVLERVPLDALQDLWLTTQDGRSLKLERGSIPAYFPAKFHLYQEMCPVHPLIASTLPPTDFCRFITDISHPVSVPRICFVDLELSELADDPVCGRPVGLPYHHTEHIRDCLIDLEPGDGKHTKTVDRCHPESFPFRCVKSGFFVGDHGAVHYYPFPTRQELESTHYPWWRSANK
jgi:hypothetical protein